LPSKEGVCERRVLANDWEASYGNEGEESRTGLIPLSVQTWSGLKSDEGVFMHPDGDPGSLASLNDYGSSFEYIADMIEEFWESL